MKRTLGPVLVLTAVAAALAAPAAQAREKAPLAWTDCTPEAREGDRPGLRQQCADLRVPLDYRAPTGPTITIRISRVRSLHAGERRGVLMTAPIGPGESGLVQPWNYAHHALGQEVVKRYDIVGFDMRGVGASSPITCGLPSSPRPVSRFPAADGSIGKSVRAARAQAEACRTRSGPVMPHITSANAARDLDRIRAALDEPKISVAAGWNGAYLAVAYDTLFPGRTDRMVLESAIDPARVWYGMQRLEAPGVEQGFTDLARWLAGRHGEYRLGRTPAEVRRTVLGLARELDAEPWRDPQGPGPGAEPGDTHVTGDNVRYLAAASALHRFYWKDFGPGAPGAGTTLRRYNERQDTGTAVSRGLAKEAPGDNGFAARQAIECGDVAWPRDISFYQRRVTRDRKAHPLTGGGPANITPCAFWHRAPAEPVVTATARGPRNVLIIQPVRDPATPYASGLGLKRALGKRASMLTVDTNDHLVHAFGWSPCATAAADAYLLTGELPGTTRCPDPGNP
ncbi:alpha/beta hydrolase [Spirillospora sp. CA-294931]|uniref:alpha/beta hydrolase n=1 Tax=Spirillospora sp. CA-294931 TaxID=3240042 RepID=UPI003D89FE1C